jgi:tetratricopeptide (TPR) repeat protein
MNPLRALPVLSQPLSRFSSALFRFAIGFGIIAGPISSPAWAAPQSRRPSGDRVVAADSEPAPKKSAQGSDLPLKPEGERKAQALAEFAQGLVAEEEGDNERAFQAYRRSLASDSNNTELSVKVAFELARRGEVAEGISLLKDAAKAAPDDMLPPLCLSQVYGKFLKKPALAIKYAQVALDLEPENIGPYLALIELYTQAGQPKKAQSVLERALKSETEEAEFWSQLGELCMKLDLKPDGSTAPDKLARLNRLFQKALACNPDSSEIQAKAADFYLESRQYEPAIPLYRKVIEVQEEPASEDGLVLREKLARALAGAGQREPALEILQKMAADAPSRTATQSALGEFYLLNGQLDRSLACYQQFLALDPSQAPVYLRIADLQVKLGQPDAAITTLQDAKNRFSNAVRITYSLAATFAQLHRYPQAVEAFGQTLREAQTREPALLDASFYLAYGMAAEQSGDLEKAATLLRKSIALAPNDSAQAANYLGYMWVDHGQHLDLARDYIRQAVKQEPQNGAYLDSLGWYFYKVADYSQAIAQLLKAIAALQSPDPVVYEHLGDVYLASGESTKALEAWEKALSLNPKNTGLPAKIENAKKKAVPESKP